ncbi:hypothetical protein ACLK1S_02950 [Escherichia coli]
MRIGETVTIGSFSGR